MVSTIIPGAACLLAWGLVMLGKAKDYGQGLADAVYDPEESFIRQAKKDKDLIT